jgi:O-methyltransferase involved in polyketide biosynthesis
MQTGQIEDVSDTAFMVAAYRAIESKRTDDSSAIRWRPSLAGSYGEEIFWHRPRWSLLGQWLVAIRTRIIHEFIETAIAQENYVPEKAQVSHI